HLAQPATSPGRGLREPDVDASALVRAGSNGDPGRTACSCMSFPRTHARVSVSFFPCLRLLVRKRLEKKGPIAVVQDTEISVLQDHVSRNLPRITRLILKVCRGTPPILSIKRKAIGDVVGE